MTWNTSRGVRVLQGAEASLVRASLGCLLDEIVDSLSLGGSDAMPLGVVVFDGLSYSQKLQILETVGRHLLRETSAPLELTADAEGTVAAIYENIVRWIEVEIDTSSIDLEEEEFDWRQMVLDAYTEECSSIDEPIEPANEEAPIDVREDDIECWRELIELLLDRILWDRDYEMQVMLDCPPESAATLRGELGVTDEYFTAIVADPLDQECEELVKAIRELTADF
ncbi:MAG: hypothetical protein KDB22_26460 [Planctomycetales bacterium]|nr:hypothetical protein [Planctomycetales bacterium]